MNLNFTKTVLPLLLLLWGFVALAADTAGKNFNVLYRNGLEKFRKHDYPEALKQLKKARDAAELPENEVKVILAIANLYSEQKNYKDAHNWVRRILDIPKLSNEDKILAYHRLIFFSKCLRRYDDALEEIGSALDDTSIANAKITFLQERARIYEEQQQYSEAEKDLRASLDLCKHDSPQKYGTQKDIMVILYKQKKYHDALDYLAKLKTENWDDYSKRMAYYYGGLCASSLNDPQLAVKYLTQMPPGAPAWLEYSSNTQLADCYSKLRQPEKAYACLDSIHKNPNLYNYYRSNALWLMAELRYRQQKYQEAKTLCEQLLKFPEITSRQRERAEKLIKSINTIK